LPGVRASRTWHAHVELVIRRIEDDLIGVHRDDPKSSPCWAPSELSTLSAAPEDAADKE
jgi:hypothetical protein